MDAVVLQCLTTLSDRKALPKGDARSVVLSALGGVIGFMKTPSVDRDPETRRALASAARKLAPRLRQVKPSISQELETWAQELEVGKQAKPKQRAKRKKRRATA